MSERWRRAWHLTFLGSKTQTVKLIDSSRCRYYEGVASTPGDRQMSSDVMEGIGSLWACEFAVTIQIRLPLTAIFEKLQKWRKGRTPIEGGESADAWRHWARGSAPGLKRTGKSRHCEGEYCAGPNDLASLKIMILYSMALFCRWCSYFITSGQKHSSLFFQANKSCVKDEL